MKTKQAPTEQRTVAAAVRSGVAWGVLFAVFLPAIVGLLMLLGDATTDGGSGGSGSANISKRKDHRRLQYTVTACTTVALLIGAAAALIAYERARNGV